MKNLLTPFLEYYDQCSDREKLILSLGIPVLVILLMYVAFWEPIDLKNERLQKLMIEEKRFAVRFDQQKQRYLSQSLSERFNWTENSLPTVVESTINEFNLSPWKDRIFQDANKNTVVSFTEIPYENLMKWLITLQTDYQINFQDATFSAVNKPGRVSCKIVLSIAG